MTKPLPLKAEGKIMTFDEFMLTDIPIAEIASVILPCEEECDHLSCQLQRETNDQRKKET